VIVLDLSNRQERMAEDEVDFPVKRRREIFGRF
jgi:hypothetical protein